MPDKAEVTVQQRREACLAEIQAALLKYNLRLHVEVAPVTVAGVVQKVPHEIMLLDNDTATVRGQ